MVATRAVIWVIAGSLSIVSFLVIDKVLVVRPPPPGWKQVLEFETRNTFIATLKVLSTAGVAAYASRIIYEYTMRMRARVK